MACSPKITANIVNSCTPVKGFDKIWMGNRSEFTRTYTANEVTIAKIGTVVLYTAEGYKDFANGGHDGAIKDMLPTSFIHKFLLNLTVGTAAAQKNIDKADDIFVFAKRKGSTQILAYGTTNGLWKTSQAQMANDNNSLIAVEFATREGEEEEYSCFFSQLTEAQLDALTA
jgi:hypothetical protein